MFPTLVYTLNFPRTKELDGHMYLVKRLGFWSYFLNDPYC